MSAEVSETAATVAPAKKIRKRPVIVTETEEVVVATGGAGDTKPATATTTATTLIDISKYNTPFTEYPVDFVEFATEHNIPLISLSSMRGQALALMAQPDVRGQKHIGRAETVEFFKNIGMETSDAIQQFNKATGFARIKLRGLYCLKYPFESDLINIDKRKGDGITTERDIEINKVKEWFQKNVISVPNKEWQVGHLDPTIDDFSDSNLAYQPPIQGKYRDRFKFDKNFKKMWPTAETELIPKFDKYYTEKEQLLIFEALKKKFESVKI